MDKYTLEALNRVIEYIYDAEYKHYIEASDEEKKNHIFKDIELVAEWVDNQQK